MPKRISSKKKPCVDGLLQTNVTDYFNKSRMKEFPDRAINVRKRKVTPVDSDDSDIEFVTSYVQNENDRIPEEPSDTETTDSLSCKQGLREGSLRVKDLNTLLEGTTFILLVNL